MVRVDANPMAAPAIAETEIIQSDGIPPTVAIAQSPNRIMKNRVTTFKLLTTSGLSSYSFPILRMYLTTILSAKKTPELIPLCHPLNITHIAVDFFPDKGTNSIRIISSVHTFSRTGVEMEALTAVSIASLTIYDMCKSYDREMTISDIFLLEKSGGKSGTFVSSKNK